MSERFRFVPPEEREPRPLPKTADFTHTYQGFARRYTWDAGGTCRVRFFQAPQHPPLIVVSQREENRKTSVTNMAPYLAAEIGTRYFSPHAAARAPFVWCEHHWNEGVQDPFLREIWAWVRFASYVPRLVMLDGEIRPTLDAPHWLHIPTYHMVRLLGHAEMGAPEEWQ